MDLEMMQMQMNMRGKMEKNEQEKKTNTEKQKLRKLSSKKEGKKQGKTDNSNEQIEKIDKRMIEKRLNLSSNEQINILKRDRPELIGIIKDLANVVKTLNEIDKNRIKAIKCKLNDCAKDCSLFLDANRTYGALLAFYLRLTVE